MKIGKLQVFKEENFSNKSKKWHSPKISLLDVSVEYNFMESGASSGYPNEHYNDAEDPNYWL